MTCLVERVAKAVEVDPRALTTPCFVYDPGAVATAYEELSCAVGTPVLFSIKANSNVDLAQRLMGVMARSGVEVASYKELNLVAARGNTPCYVNNPSMSRRLMQAAIGAGTHVVLDSPDQVSMLLELAAHRAVRPVMLRANASVLSLLRPEGARLRQDQFGMDWPTLLDQAHRLSAAPLKVAGFHLFAGSNSFRTQALRIASAAPEMVEAIEAALGYPLEQINLGGGFSHRWREDQDLFQSYRAACESIPSHVKVFHESGRALFSDCGIFVTKVLARKTIAGNQYFVCDGGIAQDFLLCGTENRMSKPASPRRLSSVPARTSLGGMVVGSSCSQDDVLGHVMPETGDPDIGELIAFEGCGAYHSSYPGQGFVGLDPASAFIL